MNSTTTKVTPDVLASKGNRLANFLIDYVVQIVLGGIIGMVIVLLSELTGSYGMYEFLIASDSIISDYVLGILILLIYYITIETLTSRSLGKFITKTKVVTHDGLKPTFADIAIRTLCRLIPFEQFSFLGEDGKGWHDSISKTYVVNIEKFEAKRKTDIEIDDIGKINA